MKVQKCKGMRDLDAEEMALFRLVEGKFRSCCQSWGYSEVRTPTIEYLYLFTSAGTLTPGRLGKVYSFLDWDGWSGERVVLRPDGTIPVARLYTEKLEGLVRLFYATNVFIFEDSEVEKRERWQCGAELIGAGSPLADVELISMSLEVLEKLGLEDLELRLSHAGLVRSLLARLGFSTEEQSRMFDQILDGNVEALEGIGRENPEITAVLMPLMGLKGESPGFLNNLKALLDCNMPEIGDCLDDFLETVALLDSQGYRYKIDIASGAGFEYYTGMIFQLFYGGEKIGGGGRYDNLIPAMGGNDVPASGFALYLDSLMKIVKPEALKTVDPQGIFIRIPTDDFDASGQAFKIARSLREAGYIVELDINGHKLSGFDWEIEVRSQVPQYSLVNKAKEKKFQTSAIDELLILMEKNCGD